MDMGSGSSSHGGMSMVFTSDHSIPLFSAQWTPTTTGGYAGTCLFLIALAIISRLLAAWRHTLETKWHDRAVQRRYIVLAGQGSTADRERQLDASAQRSDEATLTTRGMDEKVRVVRTPRSSVQATPWRISTDLPRAGVFTLQAGVGYLL